MAGSKEVRAGAAYVELITRDGKLKKGLESAQKTLNAWGDGLTALGGKLFKVGLAAQAPLDAAAVMFGKAGASLDAMSRRTGVGVGRLSELGYAARRSGTDAAKLEDGLKDMRKVIVEAAKGSDGARSALRNLGLSFDALAGRSPDEQLRLIADQLARVRDPATRAALAAAVFGESARQLLPMLANGSAGLDEMAAKARKLGLVWRNEDAKAAAEFNAALDDLWDTLRAAAMAVGKAVLPALKDLVATVTDAATRAAAWVGANRHVVRAAYEVAGAVVKAGAAIVGLGVAMKVVAGVAGGVAAVLGTLGIAGTAAAAGVIALGTHLATATAAGQKALSALGEYFGKLKETATTAVDGIRDALAAGDVELAAAVMWAGLKAAWETGIAPLRATWLTFTTELQTFGENAFNGLLTAWEHVRYAIMTGIIELKAAAKGFGLGFEEGFSLENAMLALTDPAALAAKAEAGVLHNPKLDAVGAEQDAATAAENERFRQSLEENARDHGDAMRRIEDERYAKELENAKRLKDAQDALNAARNKAKERRAEAEYNATRGGIWGLMPEDLERLKNSFLSGAPVQSLSDLNEKVSARGTFNPAAIQSLAGGGVMARVAKATEETAKNTRKKPWDRGFMEFE